MKETIKFESDKFFFPPMWKVAIIFFLLFCSVFVFGNYIDISSDKYNFIRGIQIVFILFFFLVIGIKHFHGKQYIEIIGDKITGYSFNKRKRIEKPLNEIDSVNVSIKNDDITEYRHIKHCNITFKDGDIFQFLPSNKTVQRISDYFSKIENIKLIINP